MSKKSKKVAEHLRRAAAYAADGNHAAAANYAQAAANIQGSGQAKVQQVAQQYAEKAITATDPFGGGRPQEFFSSTPQANAPGPGFMGGGGSQPQSSPTTSTPAPPPAKPPDPWTRSSNYKPPTGIKQADPDIVLFDSENISPELLLELQYEDIAGMELINISRSDIIDGQDVIYSPVKNLSSIRRRYNPNNIISLPELSSSFFSRFAIDLVQRGMNEPYFDEEGNLVIEIDNVGDDEVIEVEIDTNGTIEEVEFL